MKLLLLSTLFAFGAASASEVLQLPVPEDVKAIVGPAYAHCAAAAFTDGRLINGDCQTVHASACSGRGCQPVRYVYNFVVTWDASGYVASDTQCSVTRRHLPQAPVTTYAPGFDATNCHGPVYNPTGTVVTIDGVPYFYVSTFEDGSELVNSNVAGFLYLP